MDTKEDWKRLRLTLIIAAFISLFAGIIAILVNSIYVWVFEEYEYLYSDILNVIFDFNYIIAIIIFVFFIYSLDDIIEYYVWKPMLRRYFTNRKGQGNKCVISRRAILSLTRKVKNTIETSPDLGHLTWIVSVLESVTNVGHFGRYDCGLSVLSMRRLILKYPINHVIDNISVLDIVEGSHLRVLKVVCHICRKQDVNHLINDQEDDRKKYCQCGGLDEYENWIPDEQIYIECGYSLSDIDMNYVRNCMGSGYHTKQEAVDLYIKKLKMDQNNFQASEHR